MLVTNSLTDCRLENLIDVTLAFEYANSKLLDVVSVADVDAMERDDDSLVKILKLRFGRDFEAEVWWRILKLNFGQVKLKLGHDWRLIELWGISLVKILRLNFDQLVISLKSLWSEHWTVGFVVSLAMFDHLIVFFCFITFVFVLTIGVEFCEPISWQFQIAPIRLIDSEALATEQANCS